MSRESDHFYYDNLRAALSRKQKSPLVSWTHSLVLNLSMSSSPLSVHLLSYLPVIFAIVCAAYATAAPPTYFNTRHFVILFGVFGSWALSRLCGIWMRRMLQEDPITTKQAQGINRRRALHAILLTIKNVVFGLVPPVLLVNQTCGVFSTCRSWAPIRWNGSGLEFGGVELNPKEAFDWNVEVLYPRLVGACLVIQLGYIFVVEQGVTWWTRVEASCKRKRTHGVEPPRPSETA